MNPPYTSCHMNDVCCQGWMFLCAWPLLVMQLEKRIDQDIIVARTLIAQKKKERALLALKKKKLSENQLQSIQAYLMNVEDMVRLAGPEGTGDGGVSSWCMHIQLRQCRVVPPYVSVDVGHGQPGASDGTAEQLTAW